MGKRDDGLERLCKIYLNLTDGDKEKIITLGEGLLKLQKSVHDETIIVKERNIRKETE